LWRIRFSVVVEALSEELQARKIPAEIAEMTNAVFEKENLMVLVLSYSKKGTW